MDWQFFTDLFKGVFCFSNSIIQSIPAWISAIGLFILTEWGDKMKGKLSKARKYTIHILWGFLLFSVILTSHSLYKNKRPNFATPDELTASLLQNKDIRISDLTREDFIIRSRTFENCHIFGPAIIIAKNYVFSNVHFTEIDPNGVFIETTNQVVSGTIVLDTCVIKNCTFHKISFIGTPEDIKRLKGLVLSASINNK